MLFGIVFFFLTLKKLEDALTIGFLFSVCIWLCSYLSLQYIKYPSLFYIWQSSLNWNLVKEYTRDLIVRLFLLYYNFWWGLDGLVGKCVKLMQFRRGPPQDNTWGSYSSKNGSRTTIIRICVPPCTLVMCIRTFQNNSPIP